VETTAQPVWILGRWLPCWLDSLSRQELAEGLGVNYQTIGYLERGEYNPSLELALRAADFFGLPVEAIFSRRPFAPMSSQLYAPATPAAAAPSSTASRPGGER
jgi:putative transcriptional regulator